MAINIISISSTSAIAANSSADYWIINEGVIISTSVDTIGATGGAGLQRFVIEGTLISSASDTFDLGDSINNTGGGNYILVSESGVLLAASSAVESAGGFLTLVNHGAVSSVGSGSPALFIEDGDNNITNHGSIVASASNAVQMDGFGNSLENTGSITADDGAIVMVDGGTLLNTGTIRANDGVGFAGTGSGHNIVNEGAITSTSHGIELDGGTAQILNSGTIAASKATGHGILIEDGVLNDVTNTGDISSQDTAIEILGTSGTVTNVGTITSWNQDGIQMGANSRVINNGDVMATVFGVVLDGANSEVTNTGSINSGSKGISSSGSNNLVINSGEIISGFGAISTFDEDSRVVNSGLLSNSSNSIGTVGLIGGSSSFVNSGMVTGGSSGVYVAESDNVITNLEGGLITGGDRGDSLTAIYINSTSVTTNQIINHGDIIGDIMTEIPSFDPDFIDMPGLGVELLVNRGTIDGDVYLAGGDDIYDGADGQMIYGSEIFLGQGDDELLGGEGRERVYDGGGDDLVETGGGNDSIRAGTGQNDYDGGEGNDYLSYYDFATAIRIDLLTNSTAGGAAGNAAGNDTLVNIENLGGTDGGGDTLIGDNDANALYGWGGNDNLYGRSGNDKLVGGDGEDFFDGGAGNDRLFGEGGADTFQFDAGEDHDYVMDFENNIDTVEFDGFSYLTNAASALTYAAQEGNDVVFDFGADGMLTVFGTTTGQLANDIDIV
ncbi:calcium-binding protein [Yoonia sp. 208BN28-4]|uniref:calcium-binding protein n=1 Tax=Yoonia sp. 208BN28-4 TaxID=3126505 RepID=UPI0030AB5417